MEKVISENGGPAEQKSMLGEIVETAVFLVVVLVLAFFLHRYVAEQVMVDGYSMNDTLDDGERLIVEKVSYWFKDPERFDVVVFEPYEDDDVYYIKRVIGLPGETVQIVGDDIYIDGEVIEENYGKEPIEVAGRASEPVTLGADEFFVMGDNRNNSEDSRGTRVGSVKRSSLKGRAFLRIWPFSKFGGVE